MRCSLFILALWAHLAISQNQVPIPNPAARPPGAAGGAGLSSGSDDVEANSAARPPGAAAAAPPSADGGASARPPSSNAAGASSSGGEGSAKPPSAADGGGSARPPAPAGGGSSARPPADGGSSARPPNDGSSARPPVDNSAARPPVDNASARPPVDNKPAPPIDNSSAPPIDNSAKPPVDNLGPPLNKTSFCPSDKPIQGIGALSGNFTTDTACPANDGKLYVTDLGFYYQIKCYAHKHNGPVVKSTVSETFAKCMEMCSTTPGCRSITVGPRYPNPQERLCKMLGDPADDAEVCPPVGSALPNHDVATIIDPPFVDAPEDPSPQCATECPGAHGKTYQTENGETFVTTCCARHSTKPLTKTFALSNKACMENCGKVSQCSSTEFQIATGACFLGTRHSAPTVKTNAQAFASTYSLGCAGACKACKDCSKDQALVGGPETSNMVTV